MNFAELCDENDANCVDVSTLAGGAGVPGGSDTQIQYNNSGAFGGISGFIWDDTDLSVESDSIKLTFGAGDDGAIYYNGTNFIFDSQNNGLGDAYFPNGRVGIGDNSFDLAQFEVLANSDTMTSGSHNHAIPIAAQVDYASGTILLRGRSAGSDLAYEVVETDDIDNSGSLWFGMFKNGLYGPSDTAGIVVTKTGTGTTKDLVLSSNDTYDADAQITVKANTDFVGINETDPSVALDVVGAGAFSLDVTVPDEAYGVGWNGSLEVPTKNAVYDKIETISGSGDPDQDLWATVDGDTGSTTADTTTDTLTIAGGTGITTAVSGDTLTITADESAIDHGGLSGLTDDDHTQYALLAGRSGGQVLTGGTASGNDLTLNSTSNATKGEVRIANNTIIVDETDNQVGIGLSPDVLTNSEALNVDGMIMLLEETSGPSSETGYGKFYNLNGVPYFMDGGGTTYNLVNNGTDEEVYDLIGGMVTGNTETGITVTHDDPNNKLDFVVSDTTVAGDTGSTGMTPGDTLTVAGGTDISTAMSGDTLTINYTGSGGSGTMTTVKNNGSQVGGADIVTLDFGTALTATESPDTEINIELDHLGIEDLTDPGADRIFFWDDSAGNAEWLELDGSLTITTTVLDVDETTLDHDQLAGFVANEHIDHTSVTLTAGVGLTGGGDISSNRTFDLDVNGLTEESGFASGDFLVFYDTTAGAHRKVDYDDLPTGGSTSPGGSDTQMQYNNGGSFGGITNFVWDDTDVKITSDSVDLMLGAGDDASLGYDGTDLVLNPREVGSGALVITDSTATVGGSGNSFLRIGRDTSNVGFDVTQAGTSGFPFTQFNKSRGTMGSEATVQDDDRIGGFFFGGHDGGNYEYSASFSAYADGTVSTDTVPMRLSFETSTTDSTGRAERLQITSSGDIKIPADSKKLYFGTGDDAYLEYDGTDLVVEPNAVGSGVVAVSGDLTVEDEAYAAGWNASLQVPTKNAVYDKIESLVLGDADQNLFETINAPNGTDPVADATTDTLNFADGNAITITGDSGTDTITIAVDAASDTADGAVELATAAETDTGTDTARAITPDGLAASYAGEKSGTFQVVAVATALTTGDGAGCFTVPDFGAGDMNVIDVAAHVYTASSSGLPSFQLRNQTDTVDILSTNVTIDANEKDSKTAATAHVINTSNDDVTEGDELCVDIDAIGTGTAGLDFRIRFGLP